MKFCHPLNKVFGPKPQKMQHVLVNKFKNGDIIMIKGSFSMGMNTIVSELKRLNNLEF